jgi:hypothetical protein
MEGDKGVPAVATSIPVPRNAITLGFKFVKARKPDGTIITVKRIVFVVAPQAGASATVEATSGIKPAISMTDTIKQAPTRVHSSTAFSTELKKAPLNNDETKVTKSLSAKPELTEKRKISFP